ncbi:RCC1 domain-containing protein [Paenibacillus anseongense]|uniref:RCC1 domain-containing protein n=1 Tax=Paenibacillus anseongense TaxID=2682845 RepID=UPI002DC02821|nr:RCC1 domain-containing protein [Paenibacillus anseongense]MEC0268328.1 RCC1 domain-containing protein [Paenibacillus anseongense]
MILTNQSSNHFIERRREHNVDEKKRIYFNAYFHVTAMMIVPASAQGNPTNPPQLKTVLATGWGHSLFLKTDATLWAWGDGNLGQLGNGLGT